MKALYYLHTVTENSYLNSSILTKQKIVNSPFKEIYAITKSEIHFTFKYLLHIYISHENHI